MQPVEFKEQNVVISKDQPEYPPLPAHVRRGVKGEAIFCWDITWRERIKILFTGKIWHSVWTFRNPLQPQKLSVVKPPMLKLV